MSAVCDRLAIIAARLPAAVRARDEAGAALLLEKVPEGRMSELVMLLAQCADRRLLLAATGYPPPLSPGEAHAAYEALRKAGTRTADMPFHVRIGDHAYQQEARARQKRQREGRAA